MKKFTKAMALLLVAIMVFTGCSTAEISTKIDSNGAAQIVQILDVEKAELDKYITEKLGYKDTNAYIKSKLDGMYLNNAYFEVVTIDGVEYYEMRNITTTSSKNLSADYNYATCYSEKGIYLTKDTVYGVVDSLMYTNSDFLSIYYDALSVASNIDDKIKIKISFEFPEDIVSTNGKIDANNSKKVTFEFKITDEKTTIFATTTNETMDAVKAKVDAGNIIKKPVIKSLKVTKEKAKKVNVTLKLKKVKGAYFEIECSTKKNFSGWNGKYKYTNKNVVTFKNLKKGKKYYVRVCVWKENLSGILVGSKYAKTSIKIDK